MKEETTEQNNTIGSLDRLLPISVSPSTSTVLYYSYYLSLSLFLPEHILLLCTVLDFYFYIIILILFYSSFSVIFVHFFLTFSFFPFSLCVNAIEAYV